MKYEYFILDISRLNVNNWCYDSINYIIQIGNYNWFHIEFAFIKYLLLYNIFLLIILLQLILKDTREKSDGLFQINLPIEG